MRVVTLIFSGFLLSGCASVFVDQCVEKGESREVCEARQTATSKGEFIQQHGDYVKQWFNEMFD
jgi:uncharacterized protein YceK